MIKVMNKTFAAAFCTVLLIAGCAENKELKTSSYDTFVQEALTQGATDSITIKVSLEYPVGGASDEVLSSICKTILKNGVKAESTDFETAVSEYIDSTVADYKEANMALYKDITDGENGAFELSWEKILNGYFSGKYKNYVSYTLSSFSYSGGVHGETDYQCFCFNTEDGSIVTEKDLFKEGYEQTLNELLTSHLPDAFESDEDYEALFMKDIESNGNFSVSEDGITYIYEEYEIGPSYLGEINVTIPWEELIDILA